MVGMDGYQLITWSPASAPSQYVADDIFGSETLANLGKNPKTL